MWISELAQRSRIASRTIRYYEEQGLLPPPNRSDAGYRIYDEATVERLGFIRAAKSLGLTLDEISRVLQLTDTGQSPCGSVGVMVDDKLREVDAQIADLLALRGRLLSLDRRSGAEAAVCPIIECVG